MAQGASRLVGRDGEVNNLAQAVASARGGARTLVVIRGGAGLGKSRLVREALARYRGPEDAVGIGYGVELTGPEMPYRVATDLLRTLCHDVGIDEVREAAGPYAPALGPLHPGLTDDADHEANPARVLPAFVATLEQLSIRRLVCLVLEDLPWIDAASRDLLAYLVRVVHAGRLLVLVTVRTHDPATEAPVTEMVDALAVLDGVTTVGLAPLDAGEVAELVAGIEEGATRERIDFVVREAHGSPLLAEQLVAAGRRGASAQLGVRPDAGPDASARPGHAAPAPVRGAWRWPPRAPAALPGVRRAGSHLRCRRRPRPRGGSAGLPARGTGVHVRAPVAAPGRRAGRCPPVIGFGGTAAGARSCPRPTLITRTRSC